MSAELISIKKIKPNPKNPRFIKDYKYKELLESLRTSFWMMEARPIVVDENMVVLGGNQRLRACQELKYKEVWFEDGSKWTKEQQAEFIIKDNTHYGDWDYDMLANEFEQKDLQAWGVTGFPFDADDIDEEDSFDQLIVTTQRYTDKEIIDDAYEYYCKAGFPYPDLTKFEMMQEINKLASMPLEDCQRSRIAYKVADTFHKHRFHSSAINMKSPFDSFNIEKNLRKALKMELSEATIKKTTIPFLNLVNGTQACANFRPAYARLMYDRHSPDKSVVFDSSTGYGGRLTGFLASNCSKYIGVDPNTLTHKANQKLFNTLKNNNKECQLINLPAEDVNVDEHKIKGVADFSFTSPPYFTKEIYSDEETQSCNRYSEYAHWMLNFLQPMMKLNYDVLKSGGKTIINIEDVKIKNKVYPLVEDTIEAGKDVGFEYIKTEVFELQNRTTMQDGIKVSVPAFERVIIFKKS